MVRLDLVLVDEVRFGLVPEVYSLEDEARLVRFDSVLEDEVHFGLVHLDVAHLDFALVGVVRLVPEDAVHFDFDLEDEVHFDSVPEVLYNFFLDLFCVDRSFLMSVNLSDLPTLQILVLLLYSYW
jgi:hypothetical protein